MLKEKFNLFREFKFFSFSVLFIGVIKNIYELFIIKKIKFKKKIVKFYITNEMTAARAFLFGKKEKEVYDFIDKYLKEKHIFFDVGANVGVFSIYAGLYKNSKCFAFEPEYSNLFLLKKNIILNKLEDKISIFPCSISNKNDFSTLHLSSKEDGSALHSTSKENIIFTDENSRVVMKIGTVNSSIDHFVNLTRIYPDMLKIDTDGAEFMILKGAKKTLQTLKYLAIEMPALSKQKENCLDLLKKSKFKLLRKISKNRNLFFIKDA